VVRIRRGRRESDPERGHVSTAASSLDSSPHCRHERLIGNALPAYSKIPGQSPVISLSFLGGIGLTAYFGVFDVCKLEKDSVVVVSGAAGWVPRLFSSFLARRLERYTHMVDISTVPSDRPSFRSRRRLLDARRLLGSLAARKNVTGESRLSTDWAPTNRPD
jgi:hypothetical protein